MKFGPKMNCKIISQSSDSVWGVGVSVEFGNRQEGRNLALARRMRTNEQTEVSLGCVCRNARFDCDDEDGMRCIISEQSKRLLFETDVELMLVDSSVVDPRFLRRRRAHYAINKCVQSMSAMTRTRAMC